MMLHPRFAFSVGLPVAPHAAAVDKEFAPEPSCVRSDTRWIRVSINVRLTDSIWLVGR
jgi:hypothetical protein